MLDRVHGRDTALIRILYSCSRTLRERAPNVTLVQLFLAVGRAGVATGPTGVRPDPHQAKPTHADLEAVRAQQEEVAARLNSELEAAATRQKSACRMTPIAPRVSL